jgi:hypothetical protein
MVWDAYERVGTWRINEWSQRFRAKYLNQATQEVKGCRIRATIAPLSKSDIDVSACVEQIIPLSEFTPDSN